MISPRIEKLINDQFNMELFSSNLYLSMTSWFLSQDLDGFANFFRIQAQEEMMHAMKQFDYLHNVDGKISMKAVDAPDQEFKSIVDCFEKTLAHEQKVTASISNILHSALEEKDYATHSFFQWFINEQVEEEATMKTMLKKVKMIGENSSSLYLLNAELLQRTFQAEEGA